MKPKTEFVAAIDAFLPLRKVLIGATASPRWQRGRNESELRLQLPLEINGEQMGQFLLITAFPENETEKFMIGIQFSENVVCRVDYESEVVHANSLVPSHLKLPPLVIGPHWHPWELNRECAMIKGGFLKLPAAQPLPSNVKKFDAVLRWYCAERNIFLGHHLIALPPRERLL